MNEQEIKDGYQKFKAEKNANAISSIAEKHGIELEALNNFIDEIIDRMIFDGENLSDLAVPYELDKKQIKERRYHAYYKEILTGKSSAKEMRIYKYRDFILKKWKEKYNLLVSQQIKLYLSKIKLNQLVSVVIILLRILAQMLSCIIGRGYAR